MWKKVDIKQWPWNLAYVLYSRVYYDAKKAEDFANRLYYPGLVEVIESTLDPEEAEELISKMKYKQFLRNDTYTSYINRLASAANLQRMEGVCKYEDQHIKSESPSKPGSDILKMHLSDTDLPTRFINSFLKAQMQFEPERFKVNPFRVQTERYPWGSTVGDLTQYSRHDLMRLDHVWEKTVEQVEAWLTANGLSLHPHRQIARSHSDRFGLYTVKLSEHCTLRFDEKNGGAR